MGLQRRGNNNSNRKEITMTDEQRQQLRDRIGLRVVALRKMRGWSQQELADRAGLQRTHVGRIEAGKYAVTLETIQAIAEALGMTVDITDPRLQDLAPLHTLTPPAKGSLGFIPEGKNVEIIKVNR
jgi:transcriptional regulator with XRE-family HTH domain